MFEIISRSAESVFLITLVFIFAGLVKGVVGLGLPTVSMALLALMMTTAEAAVLLIVPSLLTNIWQIRPWGTLGPMLKRLWPMQLGICLGTLLGAWILGAPAGAWATFALGAALLVYALWGLSGLPFTVGLQTERWLGPLAGTVTGLVTAVTGVFVVPAVPYLQALGLQRDDLIQAMGISFTVSTLVLAVALYFNGSYSGGAMGGSLVMLFPALAGMYLGQALRQRLAPALFRKCFLVSLMVLGGHLMLHALPF